MIRFSITLLLYAASLVVIGGLTYFVAPPGANAATALIVSSVGAGLLVLCAVCAPLVRERRTLGLFAIYGGTALPIILGMGAVMRLKGSLSKTSEFNEVFRQNKSIELVISDDASYRNTAYQTVGIGSTVVVSAFTFLVLIMHRPKIPAGKPWADKAPKAKKGAAPQPTPPPVNAPADDGE